MDRLTHPEISKGDNNLLVEKRNTVATVFITILMGMAYVEMFEPIRESVRHNGITWPTMLLALTFFFLSMRFFVGNHLHLMNQNIVSMRGDMWLYDFLLITFETILLCFLGGLMSIDVNHHTRINFVQLMLFLYGVDVAWILSLWFIGTLVKKWKRTYIPWAWAILNSFVFIVIFLLYYFMPDIFSFWGLLLLFLINIFAFISDIFLIDQYSLV